MIKISGKIDIERVPSGIPGMDQITQGGFPEKTNILLFGPNGSGKASMCIQFARSGLELGEQVLYISTQLPLHDLRAKMNQMGLDTFRYENMGSLVLVNPLTLEISGIETDENSQGIRFIEMDINISTISSMINQAKRELSAKHIRLVMDSLTGLIINTPKERLPELYRLIETMTRRIRLQNHVALFTIDPATDSHTIERLRFIMDGFFEFKVNLDCEKPERKLIIHHLLFTGKAIGCYNYVFTSGGIEINRY